MPGQGIMAELMILSALYCKSNREYGRMSMCWKFNHYFHEGDPCMGSLTKTSKSESQEV